MICVECKTVLSGKVYCNPCVEKLFIHGHSPAVTQETPAMKTPAQETVAQQEVPPARPEIKTIDKLPEHLSDFPEELKKWNWGAFFLNWIWGIGNRVWIALIGLIPGISIIMAFVLGAKGNEWAWRSKKWDDSEHFQGTQKIWAKWGIGIFVALVVVLIICVILYVVFTAIGYEIEIRLW